MTSIELYSAHDANVYPVVGTFGTHYGVKRSDHAWLLTETEAALLVARLLAILPARTASEAVALSETIRREKETP
jgi:hypothetical protein